MTESPRRCNKDCMGGSEIGMDVNMEETMSPPSEELSVGHDLRYSVSLKMGFKLWFLCQLHLILI